MAVLKSPKNTGKKNKWSLKFVNAYKNSLKLNNPLLASTVKLKNKKNKHNFNKINYNEDTMNQIFFIFYSCY